MTPGVLCAWEWGHAVLCFNGTARRIDIKQKPAPSTRSVVPAFYAAIFSRLSVLAHSHGYALAIHGTMTRDCDILAAPWTPDAADPYTLIDAFVRLLGVELPYANGQSAVPTVKPHGRLAWSLLLEGGHEYLDVSVMPRR